jgi:hypothetical protein
VIPYQNQEVQEQAPKKVYKSPELTVYGSIVRLTQNATQKGKIDNLTLTRT